MHFIEKRGEGVCFPLLKLNLKELLAYGITRRKGEFFRPYLYKAIFNSC